MTIKPDPTTKLWANGGLLDKVCDTVKELGWEHGDEIVIKIAGTRTSGIHQTEGANPKWAPPYGDVRHNKDAQIVIENLTRRDLTKSTPMDEETLLAKFRVGDGGQLYTAHQLGELQEPTGVVDTRSNRWYNVIERIKNALSKRT
jgi:hypothetical protein